jgi:RimJ/RimL family protein N-acetyltransferase
VLFLALFSLVCPRVSRSLANVVTWGVLAVGLVLIGLTFPRAVSHYDAVRPDLASPLPVLSGVVVAFWAFTVFENLTFIAGEFKERRRDSFLAMLVVQRLRRPRGCADREHCWHRWSGRAGPPSWSGSSETSITVRSPWKGAYLVTSERTNIVVTQRLLLRPWCEEDLEEVLRLWTDPVAVQYTWRQPPARERAAAEGARILSVWRDHGFGPWAAIERASGAWIGKLGPDVLEDWPDEHNIEVGWVLDRAYWGQGIATEGALASIHYAFAELKLEQIISVTVPANTASRRVMEKAGLIYRGTRFWRNTNVVWYSIDRASWQASHPFVSRQVSIRPALAAYPTGRDVPGADRVHFR